MVVTAVRLAAGVVLGVVFRDVRGLSVQAGARLQRRVGHAGPGPMRVQVDGRQEDDLPGLGVHDVGRRQHARL